jgi:hypothetical protein
MIKKSLILLALTGLQILAIKAQDSGVELGQQYTMNVIETPVPFLNIAPDSRAGAMGDLGVATKPDINSMHWNTAKYAFIEDEMGISASYSPWLKGIANDIRLLYLTGFKRIDKQQTIAAGLRYFSLGEVIFTNKFNDYQGQKNPNEFTIDVAYSRLFSEKLSGGMAFRFIRSDLSVGASVDDGSAPSKAGTAGAVDLGVYYNTPLELKSMASKLAWGINLSNIGTKISYTENAKKDFIPANLRFGAALTLELDPYNSLMISSDFNKLLVPSPPIYALDTITDEEVITKGKNPDVSVAQGIIQSFYDAPGGFKEELKEYSISIGGEYWYRDQFALRGGYFNESAMKGNRKYFTLGLGLKMNVLTLDFSYLIPTAYRNNPLANTMRFTANFNIGKKSAKQKRG